MEYLYIYFYLSIYMQTYGTSLVAQRLKCLPAMRETWVQSLGQENPLEKEMATHSSILAWRIPQTEEPGGLQSMGSQRIGHDWATTTFTFTCPNIQDGLKRVDCFLHHLLFIEHLLCTRHWRLLIVFLNLEITLQDECQSSRQ